MADLTGQSLSAADQLTIGDDAAADAGGTGEQDQVADGGPIPGLPLGPRGQVGSLSSRIG